MVLNGELRRTAAHIAHDLRLERICLCAHSSKTHGALRKYGLSFLRGKCALHLCAAALLHLFFQSICFRFLRIDRLLCLLHPRRLLGLDPCGDTGANLCLPLSVKRHLTFAALQF